MTSVMQQSNTIRLSILPTILVSETKIIQPVKDYSSSSDPQMPEERRDSQVSTKSRMRIRVKTYRWRKKSPVRHIFWAGVERQYWRELIRELSGSANTTTTISILPRLSNENFAENQFNSLIEAKIVESLSLLFEIVCECIISWSLNTRNVTSSAVDYAEQAELWRRMDGRSYVRMCARTNVRAHWHTRPVQTWENDYLTQMLRLPTMPYLLLTR